MQFRKSERAISPNGERIIEFSFDVYDIPSGNEQMIENYWRKGDGESLIQLIAAIWNANQARQTRERMRQEEQEYVRQNVNWQEDFAAEFRESASTFWDDHVNGKWQDTKRYSPPPVSSSALDILGLKPGASKTDIQKAYRKLAMKHHPDKGGDAKKFSEITNAYKEAMG